MNTSDFFLTEVIEATPPLPPETLSDLKETVRELCDQHIGLAATGVDNHIELLGKVQQVVEALVFTSFLAGRAQNIYATDDTIKVPMDEDTMLAFIQYLVNR